VPEDAVRSRLKDWQPRAPRYTSGVFAKHTAMVGPASRGVVTTPQGSPVSA